MKEQELDALLISKRTNIRFFSGFAGSAGVLAITADEQKIFVDFRYIEQAEQSAPDFESVCTQGNLLDAAARFLMEKQFSRIGFEHENLTVAEFNRLTSFIPSSRWVPAQLDAFRIIKTPGEIAKIAEAAAILDAAFEKILPLIRPGVSERTVAASLEYEMRCLGSERMAFETILASGFRSALPHGAASDKLIEAGDLVVIDFGAVRGGYHSDMTRTVCVGAATARQREIYDIVLEAQQAGLSAVRSGVLCREVDQKAREHIMQAGFGQYFGHGLGHGVGLSIHEDPRLAPNTGEMELKSGMTVTVEPGIYVPGWGGIRIEDLIVVTETGCKILSQTSKHLLELV